VIRFVDLLYGEIHLPDWTAAFIRLPEFVRLRGVRLSNIDSVFFKDFAGPSRWEHGIAVAALADRCAQRRGLGERDRVHLVLAALLHDVGTPPFAHTAESVLANFDHEIEGHRLLTAQIGQDFAPDMPVHQSQLPQFQRACEKLSRQIRVKVDPDEIAKYITGEGGLGFLVNGAIDLDNADNVTRASLFLGLKVEADVPRGVADWLATQSHIPTDLDAVEDDAVKEWITYRNRLYSAFFDADDDELGRTAFLQHMMRRALDAGLERSRVIWATDEELMRTMAGLEDAESDDFRPALAELVQRYRLLEAPECVARVPIEDAGALRVLRHPDAVAWLTKHLRSERFDPMVLVMSRRFSANRQTTLLPEPAGALYVFHLGSERKTRELQQRLHTVLNGRLGPANASGNVASMFSKALQIWTSERPWSIPDRGRDRNVRTALKSVGDWGFRLSRNDSFHAYPSTFVHALPANLMVALGVRDDLVVDPFGGTGQTAIEAVKYGNACVSADVNTFASLVAKARLTYLGAATRVRIRQLDESGLRVARSAEVPTFELLEEWFHPRTIEELSKILGFIEERHDKDLQTFLRACLSAILPACTARRGEQHGYFADNCPLPSDMDEPPYQPAIRFFLEKTRQALGRTERLYGFIERQGRSPETELRRAQVRQVDVTTATAESYGLRQGEVGAIITSPPYLCMADYALGQRLSYEWLAPTLLKRDFDREIGSRRLRLNRKTDVVATKYLEGLDSFASVAGQLVRKGGYVAVVMGQPHAKAYRGVSATGRLDKALKAQGFEAVWSTERPIHWHRNHGYARLTKERVSVHVKA
jgi:HD superfamily phosphohydrolase